MRNEGSGNLQFNLFKTADLLYDFLLPDLINNDRIYEIIKSLLGENFNLTEILAFYSYPNNDKQELHTDVLPYFSEKEIQLPPSVIAVQFPLIEFNEISGGTRIVPITQNSFQQIPSIQEESIGDYQVITPIVRKQSCLIRDCRTWHGAGINNIYIRHLVKIFSHETVILEQSTHRSGFTVV